MDYNVIIGMPCVIENLCYGKNMEEMAQFRLQYSPLSQICPVDAISFHYIPIQDILKIRGSVFIRSMEDCLVLICHGLYHLLRRILLILPDVMLPDVLDKLVQPDILIVLVNHPSTLIQQGVIKVRTYVCMSEHMNERKNYICVKIIKKQGYPN